VRDAEKQKILEEGDIFLFPTYCQEGCPIVLLESMGAGMAVVSTRMGAIPDIVEHNKNGFLVESQDPGDFCTKVKELLENPGLLRRFQQQNKEEAEEKYRASAVTQKIESLYHEIMDG
jgi:glycosyltransferase involved in cell wall biosynthesis